MNDALGEVAGMAAIFTVIIAAITGASFWQGVGVYGVVFFLCYLYAEAVYGKKHEEERRRDAERRQRDEE